MNQPDFKLDHVHTGNALTLLRNWPARSFDLLITDPPYGNDTAYGRARRRIAGDEDPLIGLQVVAASYRLLKRDATAYVFCSAQHVGFLQHFFMRYSKFRIRELLVWDKRQLGFGATFRRAYECILVLEKGKPSYRVKSIPTLLSVSRVSAKLHPHAKPVPLIERLIEASSDVGQTVLDPFAGSGTTAVAATRLRRHSVNVEIDPAMAALANKRLAGERASQRAPASERDAA